MSKKNPTDYEPSKEEGVFCKGETVDITSDGEIEDFAEKKEATKRKSSWLESSSRSDDEDEEKLKNKYKPKTIKINGRTLVVRPAVKNREKEYRMGKHPGREIPQNSKFLGHNKNRVPEELEGQTVTLVLHFNYEVWSEHG